MLIVNIFVCANTDLLLYKLEWLLDLGKVLQQMSVGLETVLWNQGNALG